MIGMLPLVYFAHAELNEKENLNVNIEIISKQHLLENGTNSAGFSPNKKLKGDDGAAKSSGKKAKKKLRIIVKEPKMNYVAVEEDEQPFVVGLVSKSDGQIKICESPYFILKPECYIDRNQSGEQQQQSEPTDSYAQKLDTLTAAFGSSRKRKAMQTKIKNRMDTDTLEKAVNSAVEATKVTRRESAAAAAVVAEEQQQINAAATVAAPIEQYSILPVPNKNATKPVEVYDLYETLAVAREELDAFTADLSARFVSVPADMLKKWKESGLYSDYVLGELESLMQAGNGGSSNNYNYKKEKCRLLAYISFLISLYKLKSAQLRNKSPLSAADVPNPAVNRLFDLYTVSSDGGTGKQRIRTMPRRLKDKLTCHILIAALNINDFNVPLQLFQKDLKLSAQKLQDYCQALGCFVKNQVRTVNGKKCVCKMAQLKSSLNEIQDVKNKKKRGNK